MVKPMTDDPAPPPEGSNIKVELKDGTIRVRFPPLGVLRTPGTLIFLIFGAMIGISGINLAVVAYREPSYVAMSVIAFAVSAALFLVGLNTGRRRVELELAADELVLRTRSLIGGWMRRWPRSKLLGISEVETSWSQGGSPRNPNVVYALEVRIRDEKPVRLLAGRPREELQWAVRVLDPGETATSGAESS